AAGDVPLQKAVRRWVEADAVRPDRRRSRGDAALSRGAQQGRPGGDGEISRAADIPARGVSAAAKDDRRAHRRSASTERNKRSARSATAQTRSATAEGGGVTVGERDARELAGVCRRTRRCLAVAHDIAVL